MTLPIFALSVRQPWAWAVMFAGKNIENRSWQAVNKGLKKCGPIALHASKGMTRYEYKDARNFMKQIGVECPEPHLLVRGCVIGSIEVETVVQDAISPWFIGPRGLVLRNPQPCEPIPAVGALGYFRWERAENPAPVEMARWMLPPGAKAVVVPRDKDAEMKLL